MLIVDAVKAILQDKVAFYGASFGIFTWATLDLWIKHAGGVAGNLVPIASLVMLSVTIYVRLYPRAPTPAAERKEVVKSAWSWGKRFGVIAGALLAVAAVLMFWKSDAKAAQAPQQLIAAPAGKRKKSADDDGSAGDGEALPDDGPGAPAWYWKANSVIGTSETDERGRANPAVKAMFAAVDGFDPAKVDCRNVPWCAVFVNWALAQAGIAGTRSAMARSFARSRAFKKLDEPRIGCIVVIWRGSRDDGESGHVGFYAGAGQGRYFNMLGGNQSDMVKIAKFHDSRVIGYYWPRGKLESKQARGAVVAAGSATAATGAIAYGELADEKPTTPSIETVKNVLEQVQQPLEQSGHPRAMRIATIIGLVLLALTIGGAAYTLWKHSQDHSAGRL